MRARPRPSPPATAPTRRSSTGCTWCAPPADPAEDILALLQERLGNTPEQELAVIDQQLREIAALRLAGAIETEGARA